jgi:hypothetical protein
MSLYTVSPLDSASSTVLTSTSTVYTLYNNTHTVVIYNEGSGNVLLYTSSTTTSFNLNTIASQCWELGSGEIIALNVDTASDRPGGRSFHLCATTASSNADVYFSQLVQNSV